MEALKKLHSTVTRAYKVLVFVNFFLFFMVYIKFVYAIFICFR